MGGQNASTESGLVGAATEGAGATSARATGSVSYSEFWKAPEKLWKGVAMTDKEMEVVMVSGFNHLCNHEL